MVLRITLEGAKRHRKEYLYAMSDFGIICPSMAVADLFSWC